MAHPPYDPFYLPPIHHQPPPPPPPALPPQQYHHQQDNGINTLFVSGLPDDVQAREIHNLFRRKPGFDFCQLKYTGRGNQVVAFATFFNHQTAVAVLHELNGVKFDPQTGSVLHIELARSNSRRKRKPGSGAYVVIDNRTKAGADAQETSSAEGDSDTDEASPRDNTDSADKGDLVTINSENIADPGNAVALVNEQSEKTYEGGVQPCSTLFIANLGPNCTEDELKQALSVYPGFNMLHVHRLTKIITTVFNMAEQHLPQQQGQQPRSHQVVKAATGVTAGGSLLVLSGLTLAGTVILLTIATPLLVIFSPVLVPAVITVSLLIMGFLASGGFGVAAITVLTWIFRYVTGRRPPGADQLDQARMKLAGKAREMKDKAEQFGQQHITGSQQS